MVIETNTDVILIDPMLGKRGNIPTFTFFRHPPKRNPIVPFPDDTHGVLEKVTHCLITHLHPDHLDPAGEQFLIDRNIPVYCNTADIKVLKKKGLNVTQGLSYWKREPFLNGFIEGIPATHGYGFVNKLMGNVMGFYLELEEGKSIYLSSDTIYTDAVHKVLTEYQPDISVAPCGAAQLDLFKPLLMDIDDIIKFAQNSPKQMIANHLEAVNHCPITREELAKELEEKGLLEKVLIPADGEMMEL